MSISVLPFGHGVRMCLGRRLGENTMLLLTSRILQEFQISTLEKSEYVTRLVGVPRDRFKLHFQDLHRSQVPASRSRSPVSIPEKENRCPYLNHEEEERVVQPYSN